LDLIEFELNWIEFNSNFLEEKWDANYNWQGIEICSWLSLKKESLKKHKVEKNNLFVPFYFGIG
jgi:hypothetical protein